MKRFLVGLLIATFVFFGGTTQAGTVANQIIDQLLDDSPTSITSSGVNIQDYSKVAFFVDYDETEVGNAVSITITLEVSYDGTNWLSASFYDYAGGATLQTSEALTADGSYYCWFNPEVCVPQVRMKIAGTNTDADDTADVDGFIVGIK